MSSFTKAKIIHIYCHYVTYKPKDVNDEIFYFVGIGVEFVRKYKMDGRFEAKLTPCRLEYNLDDMPLVLSKLNAEQSSNNTAISNLSIDPFYKQIMNRYSPFILVDDMIRSKVHFYGQNGILKMSFSDINNYLRIDMFIKKINKAIHEQANIENIYYCYADMRIQNTDWDVYKDKNNHEVWCHIATMNPMHIDTTKYYFVGYAAKYVRRESMKLYYNTANTIYLRMITNKIY